MSTRLVFLPMRQSWYTEDQLQATTRKDTDYERWLTMSALADNGKDLTSFQSPVREQHGRNTCLMFALAWAMDARWRRHRDEVTLSPQYAYWLCNKRAGAPDPWCWPGVDTFVAADFLGAEFVCDENACPYGDFDIAKCSGPEQRALDNAWCRIDSYVPLRPWQSRGANVRDTRLLAGILADDHEIVIILGMRDAGTCQDMIVAEAGYPRAEQAHAMLIVGTMPGPTPYFICKDSLLGCYRKVSHDYVANYAEAGIVVTQVTHRPPTEITQPVASA